MTTAEYRTVECQERFASGIRAVLGAGGSSQAQRAPEELASNFRYRAIIDWLERDNRSIRSGSGSIGSPHESNYDWSRALRAYSAKEDNKMLNKIIKNMPEIRKQYPASVLFFRVGDYLECLDADALIVERYTIAAKRTHTDHTGTDHTVVSIPFATSELLISTILSAGYLVAMVEPLATSSGNGTHPD